MLRSTDQVFALRGVAGAGKTTALKEFHAGVVAAGKSHSILAPTTKAVEALKREIPQGQVQTVEAFLLASQKGAQRMHALLSRRFRQRISYVLPGQILRLAFGTLQGVGEWRWALVAHDFLAAAADERAVGLRLEYPPAAFRALDCAAQKRNERLG